MNSYISTWTLPLCSLFLWMCGMASSFHLCTLSENCTATATRAALQIHLLMLCVCALMYHCLSVQPLLQSLCISMRIHLMLNFDPSPSFCCRLPWHNYVAVYTRYSASVSRLSLYKTLHPCLLHGCRVLSIVVPGINKQKYVCWAFTWALLETQPPQCLQTSKHYHIIA